MKKKTISLTVNYLLISKTSVDLKMRALIFIVSLFKTIFLCGEIGRFTRGARNRRSNARRFFSRSSPFFGLSCLVFSSFLLFLFEEISSFFFKNRKLSQQLYIRVLLSDEGYQTIIYNHDLNITEPQTKKTYFSNTICISKLVIYFFLLLSATFSFRIVLSAFFHPHFPIRTCHSQVSVPRFTDTLYEQNRLSCGHFQTLCLLQIHEVRVVCDLFSLLSQSGATLLMRQIDCHKRTKEETKASPIHPRTLFVLRYIF